MRYGKLAILVSISVAVGLCAAQDWREQEWPGYTPPVVSLEPWFGETAQVFDKRLLGRWVLRGEINEGVWRFKRGPGGSYKWTIHNKWWEFHKGRAVIAKVNGKYYLDAVLHEYRDYQADELIEWPDYFFVAHHLAQLQFGEQKIRLIPLDLEKLEEVISKQRLRGAWARMGLLIVSPTEELQEFLADEGGTADIWIETGKDKWLERPQRHADSRQSSAP